ncbi:MAG: MFS transporter [archaeon]|nr:MAG: MFS transporter [archaeon]
MHFREYMRYTEVSAIFLFATFLFNPILSPYMKGLGFTELQMSVLFSFLPLSMIIFSPLMGKLSDLTSRRHVIVIGIALEIVAVVLYVFGRSFVFMGVARVLDAIGYSTVVLISLAKVEDTIDKRRGEYTGWAETLNFTGRMAAPVIGAVIADLYFIEAPFFISLVILFLMLGFLFRKEKFPKLVKKPLNPLEEIREFISHRKLRGMSILGIVMHASQPGMTLFLPLFIVYNMGLELSYVGYAFFILEIMHIFQFWFGKKADRHGAWKLVLGGCLTAALGMGLLYISSSFLTLAIFLFIQGIGRSMWNVSAWSLMSDVGEKKRAEGEIAASYASIAKIGAFISFILSGLLVTALGIQALFLFNAVIIVIGVVLAYNFFK